MSVLLAVTLAAAIQPTCSWDHPGRNPYTGSAAAAVDRYTDIPAAVRSTLKRRIEEHLPDDNVSITRDGISGNSQYDPAIRDMHFGAASMCATVTRNHWAASRNEPGAVYCVGEHCILVPRICGNVSRISKQAPALAAAPEVATASQTGDEKPTEFADYTLYDPDPHFLDLLPDEAAPRMLRAPRWFAFDNAEPLTSERRDDTIGLPRPVVLTPAETPPPSAVPEPESWAMLLSGAALVGWLARRRGRQAAK